MGRGEGVVVLRKYGRSHVADNPMALQRWLAGIGPDGII